MWGIFDVSPVTMQNNYRLVNALQVCKALLVYEVKPSFLIKV
jgi:hypothetical protein